MLQPEGENYLLICTHFDNGNLLVDLAFIILPELVEEIKALQPLILLQKFAVKFGLTIRVGEQFNKFIFRKIIYIKPTQDLAKLVEILNPENHSFISSIFIKIEQQGDRKTADCALAYCIDSDKYLEWIMDRKAPRNIIPHVVPQISGGFFIAQKTILESLFGSVWFKTDICKKEMHPAYKRWLLCEKLIKQNEIIRWPEDKEVIPDVASIILDNYFIVKCSGGDVNRFSLGNFSNYGDEKVRKRIYSEIIESNKFFDKLTELAYAAWHLSEGNKVVAYEEIGYPDFKISLKDTNLPIVTDCKRVNADTNDRRYAKVINKANKQIKALNEKCYGIVVIDISNKIINPDNFSDAIPMEVERISSIVQNAIRASNRCVSGVLLLWDDYVMHGIPGKNPNSLFAYRRRSRVLKHINPWQPLPEGVILFEFGNTLTYRITWTHR